jgi:hypothetical protein
MVREAVHPADRQSEEDHLKDIQAEAYKRYVGEVIDPLRLAPRTGVISSEGE